MSTAAKPDTFRAHNLRHARYIAKGLNCSSTGIRPCGRCESCQQIDRSLSLDVLEFGRASDGIECLLVPVLFAPARDRHKVILLARQLDAIDLRVFEALRVIAHETVRFVWVRHG